MLVVNKNKAALKAMDALSNSAKRIQYNFDKMSKKTYLKLSDDAPGLGMSESFGTKKTSRRKTKGVGTMIGTMMLSAFGAGGTAGGGGR